jgi:hypothetical protein
MTQTELNTMVAVARQAQQGGFSALSISQKLTAAFVLIRPDWLADMNFTLSEAIEHLGSRWLALIPAAAHLLFKERPSRR